MTSMEDIRQKLLLIAVRVQKMANDKDSKSLYDIYEDLSALGVSIYAIQRKAKSMDLD